MGPTTHRNEMRTQMKNPAKEKWKISVQLFNVSHFDAFFSRISEIDKITIPVNLTLCVLCCVCLRYNLFCLPFSLFRPPFRLCMFSFFNAYKALTSPSRVAQYLFFRCSVFHITWPNHSTKCAHRKFTWFTIRIVFSFNGIVFLLLLFSRLFFRAASTEDILNGSAVTME